MGGESLKEAFSLDRAELFEALGHPTRMRILHALAYSPLCHSDLKRTAGVESSGLMAFHLSKLDGLVKTTPEGSYTLTDEGKEALRMTSMEPIKEERLKHGRKRLKKAVIVALILLIVSIAAYSIYRNEYSKFDRATQSLQMSGFKITNITVVESDATEPSMKIAMEIEYYVRNPTEYAFRLVLFDIDQVFKRSDYVWGVLLKQTSPCLVQPNSTAVLKVATEDYSIHGYINGEYDAVSLIYPYLSSLTGRNQLFGAMGHDVRTKALFSTDIFLAYKQKNRWSSMWQGI